MKTSLYFLFKNFNAKYKYPVIILHEGDYGDDAKNEILTGIRSECRSLLTFKQIDDDDFCIPSHIDVDKMNRIIDLHVVPYWRNQRYRSMCSFWVKVKYAVSVKIEDPGSDRRDRSEVSSVSVKRTDHGGDRRGKKSN